MHSELQERDTLMVVNENGIQAEGKAPKNFVGFTYSTEDATLTGKKYAGISGNLTQVLRRKRPAPGSGPGSKKDFSDYFTVDAEGTRVFAEGVGFIRSSPSQFDGPGTVMPPKVEKIKAERKPKTVVKLDGSLTEAQLRKKIDKIITGRDGSITFLLNAQLGKAEEPKDTKSTLDLNDPAFETRLEDRITNIWAGRVFSIEEYVPAPKAEKPAPKAKAPKAGDPTPKRAPRLVKRAKQTA